MTYLFGNEELGHQRAIISLNGHMTIRFTPIFRQVNWTLLLFPKSATLITINCACKTFQMWLSFIRKAFRMKEIIVLRTSSRRLEAGVADAVEKLRWDFWGNGNNSHPLLCHQRRTSNNEMARIASTSLTFSLAWIHTTTVSKLTL